MKNDQGPDFVELVREQAREHLMQVNQVEADFIEFNERFISLTAENECLEKESRKRMLALESLTCGGSEYAGDVERCVEYVRNGRDSQRTGTGKKIKAERVRAEQVDAQLNAVRKAWNDNSLDCSADPGHFEFTEAIEGVLFDNAKPDSETE